MPRLISIYLNVENARRSSTAIAACCCVAVDICRKTIKLMRWMCIGNCTRVRYFEIERRWRLAMTRLVWRINCRATFSNIVYMYLLYKCDCSQRMVLLVAATINVFDCWCFCWFGFENAMMRCKLHQMAKITTILLTLNMFDSLMLLRHVPRSSCPSCLFSIYHLY